MAMAEGEIFSSFAEILEKVGGVPASAVTYDADITDDLEVSSLALVEVITVAEDTFDIEIPDDALKDLRTVRSFVSYVQRTSAMAAT
jgi:acyl carrier protein